MERIYLIRGCMREKKERVDFSFNRGTKRKNDSYIKAGKWRGG